MKFYKFVARPTLLYSNETWVTTKRDMTSLEAAEMSLKVCHPRCVESKYNVKIMCVFTYTCSQNTTN